MRLKTFNIRFSAHDGGFDDSDMQEFLADKEVVGFTDHFFVHEGEPWLCVIVSYREVGPDERGSSRNRQQRKDPRRDLDELEQVAYDALRTWRAARAKQDGVPVYLVANNRQLSRMIKLKAASKTALLKVEGFGEEKTKNYGDELLDVLKEHLRGGESDEDSQDEAEDKKDDKE